MDCGVVMQRATDILLSLYHFHCESAKQKAGRPRKYEGS